jgi:hypothetical protein
VGIVMRATVDVDGASLPSGVCYWRQGSLINGVATGATEDIQHCRFEVQIPASFRISNPPNLGFKGEIVELF